MTNYTAVAGAAIALVRTAMEKAGSHILGPLSLDGHIIYLLCLVAVLVLTIWLVKSHLRWRDKLTPAEREEIAKNGDW